MVEVFLKITTWILIGLSVVMVFGNGIIVLTVAKNPLLRQKQCLYLIAALAVANFITGEYCSYLLFGIFITGIRDSEGDRVTIFRHKVVQFYPVLVHFLGSCSKQRLLLSRFSDYIANI
jgi:hypothetical protein